MVAEGQKKGMKVVEAKSCIALLHNAEKAASAECGMHILHALLLGPLESHAGVLISHSNGVEVRALACSSVWTQTQPEVCRC